MITIAVTVTQTGLASKFPPILGLLPALTMTKIHTLQPGYYVEGVDSDEDKLVTQPLEGIHTVADIISYSARTHDNTRNALGWRDIIQEEKEVTKVVYRGSGTLSMMNDKHFQTVFYY